MSGNSAISFIKFIDLTGRTVKQVKLNGKTEANISISNLSDQMNILQLQYTNGAVSSSKIVKR